MCVYGLEADMVGARNIGWWESKQYDCRGNTIWYGRCMVRITFHRRLLRGEGKIGNLQIYTLWQKIEGVVP